MMKLWIFIILTVLTAYLIFRQIRKGNNAIKEGNIEETYNFKQRRKYWDFHFFRELCENEENAFICLRYFYGLVAVVVLSSLFYFLIFWLLN